MANNIVLDFFRELLNRLFTKSPKFFKVLQVVTGLLTFAGYIPSMLQRWLGVEVPGHVITLCEDIAKYAAGGFLLSMLPAKQVPVAQTTEGEAIKVSDDKKMPFTAKAEEKAMAATEPPTPTVTGLPENEETDK